MVMELTQALKEWKVAVTALEEGDTILLLRKGGIKEKEGKFSVQSHQVVLFPTYEHQKPHLLKPPYHSLVTPVSSGWHPKTISIGSWAKITDILRLTEQDTLNQLLPYHIWNEDFASQRLNWKPHQPLYLLLLRVYKWPKEIILTYSPDYGGCKSWIKLNQPISIDKSYPVLEDCDYLEQVNQIREICQAS